MNILFTIVYCVGLIAIVGWIVFAWTKYTKTHHIPEIVENLLGVILFVIVLVGGYMLLNVDKKQIEDDYKHTQTMFCLGTQRDDGEFFTDDQCQYFQNVLNGKYYDSE